MFFGCCGSSLPLEPSSLLFGLPNVHRWPVPVEPRDHLGIHPRRLLHLGLGLFEQTYHFVSLHSRRWGEGLWDVKRTEVEGEKRMIPRFFELYRWPTTVLHSIGKKTWFLLHSFFDFSSPDMKIIPSRRSFFRKTNFTPNPSTSQLGFA